jgi:hypothetical protein
MLLKSRAQRLVGLTVLQTLEVAFARVYNWDVAQRRRERGEAESIQGKKGPSSNGWQETGLSGTMKTKDDRDVGSASIKLSAWSAIRYIEIVTRGL